MKKVLVLLIVLAVGISAQTKKVKTPVKVVDAKKTETVATENTTTDTLKLKASYGIGHDIARNIKAQNLDVDFDKMIKGFTDALKGNKPDFAEEELNNALMEFQSKIMAKKKAISDKNLAVANEFLAANKTKPGVITTESGLQYKVLQSGTGASPVDTNEVEVHYKVALMDGKEFESSYKRNQTSKFPVTGVIKGWTEALKLMKVGDKFELFVPPHLAYGEQGRPSIPANSLLIFEVELISIVK